jgi:RNA polymerase sigma-70 factor, ECF subfamily
MADSTIDISEDETSLVKRLQSGEPLAFETLVRVYAPRLLAVTRRFLRNEEDAQDALQDSLLSAFRAIQNFSGNAQLGTWLHRIAVNAALMRLRSRSRDRESSIDELLPQFVEDGHQTKSSVAWPSTAESLLERRETAELVRRSIDQLPESYRSILLLRDIEEIDTEEAARMLDMTPGAVKTRLHRARQALRTLLDPYMQGELV